MKNKAPIWYIKPAPPAVSYLCASGKPPLVTSCKKQRDGTFKCKTKCPKK